MYSSALGVPSPCYPPFQVGYNLLFSTSPSFRLICQLESTAAQVPPKCGLWVKPPLRDQAVDPWSAVGGTAKGQELVDAVDLVSKVDKNANVVDRGSARPQGQPATGCAARGVVGR